MTPQRRSLVIVVALALCGPLLLDVLRGAVPLGAAAARYGLALVLTWVAIRGLDGLVSGYREGVPQDLGEGLVEGHDPVAATAPAVDRRQFRAVAPDVPPAAL